MSGYFSIPVFCLHVSTIFTNWHGVSGAVSMELHVLLQSELDGESVERFRMRVSSFDTSLKSECPRTFFNSRRGRGEWRLRHGLTALFAEFFRFADHPFSKSLSRYPAEASKRSTSEYGRLELVGSGRRSSLYRVTSRRAIASFDGKARSEVRGPAAVEQAIEHSAVRDVFGNVRERLLHCRNHRFDHRDGVSTTKGSTVMITGAWIKASHRAVSRTF